MRARRGLWLIIGILAVCVVAISGLLGYVLLRPPRSTASLLISDDATGLRVEHTGRESQVVASDVRPQQYRFPAISPDGKQVAYIGAKDQDSALYVHDFTTGERRLIYSNPAIEPFDIAWSPDSRNLVFLAPGPGALVLAIVPADGSSQPKPIALGSNIYFAWSDDGSQLVLHIGSPSGLDSQVMIYHVGDDKPKALAAELGFFQAPAITHDGKSVFYVNQPAPSAGQLSFDELVGTIVRAGVDGSAPVTLATEKQAALRIVRSPTSDAIAYSILHIQSDSSFAWGELKLVEEGKEPRVLSGPGQHVDAFFWSPDGTQIAYLAHGETFEPRGPRALNVVSTAGGEAREIATFTPSSSFADLNGFFDAYVHGFTPWSPDSRRLAFAADDGIYVADTGSSRAEKVGDGTFVLWSKG